MSTATFPTITKEDIFLQLQHIGQKESFSNEYYPFIDMMVQSVASLIVSPPKFARLPRAHPIELRSHQFWWVNGDSPLLIAHL